MATGPQVFRPGVKYVKLAKFDTGSVSSNLTIPLGEIKKIRVNYSDKGIIEYPIQTISEYPDYYLYRVATTDATSSADNDTPEFYFTGSKGGGSIPKGVGGTFTNGLGNLSSGSVFTYDSSLGTITTSKTSQIELELTASIVNDSSTPNTMILSSNKRGNLKTLNYGPDGELTYKGTLFTDETLSLRLSGITGTFDSSSLLITTGSGAYTVTNGTQLPTVLEPFFESKFTNEDCDVLLGNATEPRLSTLYFDIDYSTSQVAPVNLQAILSGSAVRAQVPDSNYTSIRSITPRYEGSKNTISSSFDRHFIQSTSSLAPINNYVSAIVEYEPIVISGSTNPLLNERVPNNIIFIDSLNPGETSEKTKSEAVLELERQIEGLQNQLNEFDTEITEIESEILSARADIIDIIDGGGTLSPRLRRLLPPNVDLNNLNVNDINYAISGLEDEKRELSVNRGRVNEELINLENRLQIISTQNFLDTNIFGSQTIARGNTAFFPTIQQIFRKGDAVNFFAYDNSETFSSASVPLVTRIVEGFSSSKGTIVFEDKVGGGFFTSTPAEIPTGRGAMFSIFSSPTITRNLVDITKQLGNNGDRVIVGNQIGTQTRNRGN